MKPKSLVLLIVMSSLMLSTVFLLTSQPVKAQGYSFTINSDGSITPNNGLITTTDQKTYTLTTDITGTIETERDNIILNGNGHTLQSPDPGFDTGIYFYGYPNNVTIENMKIANFEDGVTIGGSYIQVIGNTFTNCSYIAVNGYQDDHCTISNNNIAEEPGENSGIWLLDANYTVISNNNITGGLWAVNTGYGTTGIEVDYPFISDQINGNSITSGEWGIFMSGSDVGTAAYQDKNNQIFNNTILNFTEGVSVGGIDTVNNYFYNNQVVNSSEYGIEVGTFGGNAACNDTFYSNTITGSGACNIIVGSQGVNTGQYNNFTGNNVTGSPVGIELYNDAWGNIINGNYIANNNVALHLEYNASSNIIIGNKVRSNQVAIEFAGTNFACNNNQIYHNDFVSNTQQVSQGLQDGSLNVWDNGYPSGGNYWTDYTGVDHYHGAAQNVAGADGIGDTPYTTGMVGTNKDNYPFMTIMYNQTGVGSDFTGTILTVDSSSYTLTQLPVSYMWSPTASHQYAFQSPLTVTPFVKRYVWMNNTGLSPSQSMSSIVVPYHGNITGNYITQYYMTVNATPNGALGGSFQVTYTQLGVLYTNQVKTTTWSDWVDANTTVTVTSPQQYVPSASGANGIRYRFDSYNQSISSVYMDNAKLITLLYVTQYSVSFIQTGVGNDFSGTVVTVNGTTPYGIAGGQFWADANSIQTFVYSTPLTPIPNSEQYVLTG
ncbi:MAG: NosD domain-containing protein, partial [Candidatus Bathyarchaeia archaeon]